MLTRNLDEARAEPMERQPASALPLLALAAAAGAGVLVYLPAVHGGFVFDDFPVIVNNPALRAAANGSGDWLTIALSSDTGPLRRPLSMLSLGLNAAMFGMSPVAFKAANLAIHLLTALLLFAFARCVTAQRLGVSASARLATYPALFAAVVWMLHPLNLSSVAYVVQRMNELASLFTLAGLLCYARARRRSVTGESTVVRALGGLCLFGLLAALCKENGALIVGYAFVTELTVFRFKGTGNDTRVLRGFYWLALGLPAMLCVVYFATHPTWLAGAYAHREFTLAERLLTQGRVLWAYLLWIFIPNPAWMGLYHDDIAVSTSLMAPPTTLVALAGLACVAATAIALHRRYPAYAFAVGWFLLGHSLESSVLPLELVFEHRNYLPMAGLLIGIAIAVARWAQGSTKRSRVAVQAALLATLACATLTAARARDWSDPLRMALADAAHHPASARSQYEAGRAIVIDGAKQGRRARADDDALPYFDRAASLDKVQLHGLIASLLIHAGRGPVDPTQIAELRRRLTALPRYNFATPFLDMLVTASTDPLSLSAQDVSSLVEAALANPRMPPKIRALVLNNYGAYQFNVLHAPQAAIALTVAAAAEEPANPYFQLNLAQIAWTMRDAPRANRYLQEAQRLDVTHIHAAQIAALHAKIAAPDAADSAHQRR